MASISFLTVSRSVSGIVPSQYVVFVIVNSTHLREKPAHDFLDLGEVGLDLGESYTNEPQTLLFIGFVHFPCLILLMSIMLNLLAGIPDLY
jgi:hypothetical protein